MFCQGQPNKWSQLIPMVEFVHNSATHLSTQKSLFSLILGYEPRDYPKIGQTFLPSLEDRLTVTVWMDPYPFSSTTQLSCMLTSLPTTLHATLR